MKYLETIQVHSADAGQMEAAYQSACLAHEAGEFKTDLDECYREAPQNLLFAAWHYRLNAKPPDAAARRAVNWMLALPLSFLSGSVLWLMSDPNWGIFSKYNSGVMSLLYFFIFWAPWIAILVIAFVALTARKGYARAGIVCGALILVSLYAFLLSYQDRFEGGFRGLVPFHLPLLAWIGVGIVLTGLRAPDFQRFAYMAKTIEVVVTGGVYFIAIAVFTAVTSLVFNTLTIGISESVTRLMLVGGAGLLPVFVVATLYDPLLSPAEQDFHRGLSRMIAVLPRLLLPLTILVLVIYIGFIPFNFRAPFEQREVLIVFNVMLFAIIGLLIGVTPLNRDDLPERIQKWLRLGILVTTSLVMLVSLYAMSAIIVRTVIGGWTINRLMTIGWNAVNMAILAVLIYKQFRKGLDWISGLHQAFNIAFYAYLGWGLFMILVSPWLF